MIVRRLPEAAIRQTALITPSGQRSPVLQAVVEAITETVERELDDTGGDAGTTRKIRG